MSNIKVVNAAHLASKHKCEHKDYEYRKKTVIGREEGAKTQIGVYELPPLKSAYPYHYHEVAEETFYILSGTGELRTPDGIQKVGAGDFLYFPPNPAGAHKLSNLSEREPLVYIDFDVVPELDACIYPDSKKVGVFGKEIHKFFGIDEDKGYYDGE